MRIYGSTSRNRKRFFSIILPVVCLTGCTSIHGPLDQFFGPPEWPVATVDEALQLDTARLEQAIHAEINRLRAERGVPKLEWADPLAQVARAHSRDMAERAYFDHRNRRGEEAYQRAQRAGLECDAVSMFALLDGVGENLFLTHLYDAYYVQEDTTGARTYLFDWKSEDEIAVQAIRSWFESRSHRANLLSPVYQSQAVGVAVAENASVFVTQNLCSGELEGRVLAAVKR